MWIDAVGEAYSNRDFGALAKALESLQRELISAVQALGPAAVALQMGKLRELKIILNKIPPGDVFGDVAPECCARCYYKLGESGLWLKV